MSGNYTLVIRRGSIDIYWILDQGYKDEGRLLLVNHWIFGRITIYILIFILIGVGLTILSLLYLIKYNMSKSNNNNEYII